jgi:hypothetical protein
VGAYCPRPSGYSACVLLGDQWTMALALSAEQSARLAMADDITSVAPQRLAASLGALAAWRSGCSPQPAVTDVAGW